MSSAVRLQTDAPVEFGLIPPEHWLQPEWIDENKAKEVRKAMASQAIPYGGAPVYHPPKR